jgi:hypothetical protein
MHGRRGTWHHDVAGAALHSSQQRCCDGTQQAGRACRHFTLYYHHMAVCQLLPLLLLLQAWNQQHAKSGLNLGPGMTCWMVVGGGLSTARILCACATQQHAAVGNTSKMRLIHQSMYLPPSRAVTPASNMLGAACVVIGRSEAAR